MLTITAPARRFDTRAGWVLKKLPPVPDRSPKISVILASSSR
ncbi:MAG: hypothetical protein M0Z42_06925 [Actinomycetota bacterium]|nr:hypothetical protein [Actinomycetota bacterium]